MLVRRYLFCYNQYTMNFRKKIGKWIPAGLVILSLSGCATDNAIPDLSDEEMQMVEEYAASLLLKYDKNYIETTISEAQIEEERVALEHRAAVQAQIAEQRAQEQIAREAEESEAGEGSGEDAPDGSDGGEAETPVYTDIDEFFSMDGVEISYAGYVVCDSYPTDLEENDWQGVARAGAGNKLIAFSYTVTNLTGEDLTVDMAGRRARFNFRIKSDAGDVSKSSLATMLLSDMSIFRETLVPGETKTAVLVVEVTQDIASSLSGITMVMREGDARAELTLL